MSGTSQVNPLDGAVLDAIGEHLMKPAAAGSFTGIDLSNMFWACGILGINPCEGRLLPALAKHVTLKTGNMNQQVRKSWLFPLIGWPETFAYLHCADGRIFVMCSSASPRMQPFFLVMQKAGFAWPCLRSLYLLDLCPACAGGKAFKLVC